MLQSGTIYTEELSRLLKQFTPAEIFGNYPIYSETHRAELNNKICNHYADRQIGFLAPRQFIQRATSHMAVKMPYYNDLYRVASIHYDPLVTRELRQLEFERETRRKTADTTSKNTVDNSASSREADDLVSDVLFGLDTATTGNEVKDMGQRESREVDHTKDNTMLRETLGTETKTSNQGTDTTGHEETTGTQDTTGHTEGVTHGEGTTHGESTGSLTGSRDTQLDTETDSSTDTTRTADVDTNTSRDITTDETKDTATDTESHETGSLTGHKYTSDTPQQNLGPVQLNDGRYYSEVVYTGEDSKKDSTGKSTEHMTDKVVTAETGRETSETAEDINVIGNVKSSSTGKETTKENTTGSSDGTSTNDGTSSTDSTSNVKTTGTTDSTGTADTEYSHDIATTQNVDEKANEVYNERESKNTAYDHEVDQTGTVKTNTTENTHTTSKAYKDSDAHTTGAYAKTEGESGYTVGDSDLYTSGRDGFSPTALMLEYRQAIQNIDELIIKSLEYLFLGVLD